MSISPPEPPGVSKAIADAVCDRIESLTNHTDEPPGLTRAFLSPALRGANNALKNWAAFANLRSSEDAFGNIIIRRPGDDGTRPRLIIGSHLDTVRDAGRFDGILGVLTALACLEQLEADKAELPFEVEVVSFSDEEGLRYHTAFLGSEYYAGLFDAVDLDRKDADGIPMGEAVRRWGTDPEVAMRQMQGPANPVGYLEIHIEQGPVLEERSCAIGVVSGIAGQHRIEVSLTGKANHAGTTPPASRYDALTGAAEVILETERMTRFIDGLRATVGQIRVEPNASNVIPGKAIFSLDIRHPNDATLLDSIERVRQFSANAAGSRDLKMTWETRMKTVPVACDKVLTDALVRATGHIQEEVPVLVSGAGHDAVALSRICPVAMLFIRCRDGLSHHPDEFSSDDDIRTGVEIFHRSVLEIASTFAND